MMIHLVLSLSLLAAALPSANSADAPPFFPVHYAYGDYQISTNITYGTPPQKKSIPTIVDLGSANYWVNGPNATVNSGSNYLFVPGPCNQTVRPFFNWPKSSTATKPVPKEYSYAYGGNGKIVSGHYSVNDTISFAQNVPSFKNQRVAITNFTILKQLATTCDGAPYDKSILGISAYAAAGNKNKESTTLGPSFRQDLLENGSVQSPTISFWFDKAKDKVTGTFRGTVLFGAVPKSKFSGPLVRVAPKPPTDGYVGYYVAPPTVKVSSVDKPSRKTALKTQKEAERCLIDSGTGNDNLPIVQEDFLKASGLIISGGFPAYNGSCDDLPKEATLDYTFAGLQGKSVTVKVPLRNYARGNTDYLGNNKCGLSMILDAGESCVFGSPFQTAVFFAANDDPREIALAQGGVSSGARKGADGLGEYTIVKKGQKLPYTSN